MISCLKKNHQLYSFLFIIVLTIYRIYFLYLNKYALYGDEAQYWDWSRNLSFGYYSKPAMIAWLIRLTTIFDDSEFSVRLSSPLMHASTAFLIYLLVSNLTQNLKSASISAIIYISLPAVSLSSSLISTDPILIFFWAATLLFFVKSLETDKYHHWLFAAIFFGLGLMTKYNMGIFAISSLLFLYSEKKLIQILKNHKFYIALILTFTIYLPNLMWNYNNDFVSYHHTQEISAITRKHKNINNLLEFLAAQIIIITPILFFAFFSYIRQISFKDKLYKITICYSLPLYIIISLLSIIGKAYANWAAPTIITIIIAAVQYLVSNNKQILIRLVIILNIAISLVYYNYDLLFAKDKIAKLTNNYIKHDPFNRVYGWRELTDEIKKINIINSDTNILVGNRKLYAELSYYLRDINKSIYKFNNKNRINDHYDLTRKIDNMRGENFIYIDKAIYDLDKYFEEVNLIKKIHIPIYKGFDIKYNIYQLNGFYGYNID